MTEEEAKTKACCGPPQAAYGKTDVINCIGSACMAWRWGIPVVVYGSEEIGANANHVIWKPEGDGWVFQKRRWQKETPSGYCGLAGKP